MKDLYERPAYTKLLDRYRDTPQIKVLKGIRRCGKSSILDLYIRKLLDEGIAPENIVRRRFDEFGQAFDIDAEDLQSDLQKALASARSDSRVYVFLDEIQAVSGWEQVVRGLQGLENTDVYITGSNAYLLSSDIATLLAGRYIEIDVYPLSYGEYLSFSEQTADQPNPQARDELFADYVRFGGMPTLFSLRHRDMQDVARDLSGIYDSVILNDVAQRFSLRDFSLLQRLVKYLFSTSGNLFSTNAIMKYLKSTGARTSFETIESYIYALEQALIVSGVEQFNIMGKQLLNPQRKYYPADTGLRNLVSGFALRDTGFQLENVVFLELKRRGYDVSIGQLAAGEVDFVAARNDERVYVQVCQTLAEDATYEREISPLREVRDAFPKMVLTMDRLNTGITPEGIQVKYLTDWLLEG